MQEMKTIAIIIALLVGLVLLFGIGLHLWAYGSIWLGSMIASRRLATNGRILSLSEATKRLESGEGVVVVDSPTLGWNVSRIWWAPSALPVPRPESWSDGRMCPDEDHMNYDRLIDLDTGGASLIRRFIFSGGVERMLLTNFGTAACLYVFSGAVAFDRALEDKEKKHNKSEQATPRKPSD